jgi:hypothetical protein
MKVHTIHVVSGTTIKISIVNMASKDITMGTIRDYSLLLFWPLDENLKVQTPQGTVDIHLLFT